MFPVVDVCRISRQKERNEFGAKEQFIANYSTGYEIKPQTQMRGGGGGGGEEK